MELRTTEQWMNMVFGLSQWSQENEFKILCKNIKSLVKDDFYLEGRQTNTQAYDIISTLMKEYFNGYPPMTHQDLRKVLDMGKGTRKNPSNDKFRKKLLDHYKNYNQYNTSPNSNFPEN